MKHWWRFPVLIMTLLFGAHAQTPITLGISTGSPVKIGSTGSRDVVLTSVTGNSPAGVEFTLTWSATLQNVAVSAAAQTTAAAKTVTCGRVFRNADTTSSMTCTVSGLNANLIANGSIVTVTLTVSKSATVANSGTISVVNTTVQITGGTVIVPNPLAVALNSALIAATGGTGTIAFRQGGRR